MIDWIGETFASDVGWEHLETLVDTDIRMASTEGERHAAEATRGALAATGARNTRLEPFDLQGWSRGSTTIHAGETTQDCIALPRSPSGEATRQLLGLQYR